MSKKPVIELYPEDLLGKTAKQLLAEVLNQAKDKYDIVSCEKCSRIGKEEMKFINAKDFKLEKGEEISPSIHAWFDILCLKCYGELSKPKKEN